MIETENRMVPMNCTVDLARQNKLSVASSVTGIGKSELIRYMIDCLEKELGNLENPDPRKLERLQAYCNTRGITKGTLPRGRKPSRQKS